MKKNIKKLSLIAVLSASAIALSGCSGAAGGSSDDSAKGGDGGKITLTLGHAGSETDPRQTEALEFKKLVEEKSNGNIEVKVYPSSTLGTWEEEVEGLQLGTVDVVIEGLLALEKYSDLAAIETVPFLYDSPESFFKVWDGDLGKEIKQKITDASGYEMLGNMYRGSRELNTKEPVTKLEDLKGMTIRTPSTPTMLATWEALGARAEALSFDEVYSSLQSGVLDGEENPLDTILFNSIAEVAPEITWTNHQYANYHFLMWGDALAALPEEDQKIIREAADQVGKDATAATVKNLADYEKQLKDAGAHFHEMENRDKWVEAVQPVIDGLPEQVKEWTKEIQG